LIKRVKYDYDKYPDYEGGMAEEDAMMMGDMMANNNAMSTKSKKKRKLKKARICGKRLT
jgi:roadblock/LC7 domain-containing protein